MKLTPWYPCSVKPKRIGWYDWNSYKNERYWPAMRQWWDGKQWKWHEKATVAYAPDQQWLGYWRGVAK